MITIPLPGNQSPLSNLISYSVSPLYEMAASLYTLAQETPPERFAYWTEEKVEQFESARLLKEWGYFVPLFRYGIPDSFDPLHTKGVMAVDDQYEYFVTLPTDHFVRSMKPILEEWISHHDAPVVAFDLEEDADYVKGRFSLFVSSYWQLFFEANWEAIAPKFVREAERIYYSLQGIESLTTYLQTISPAITYDTETHQLTCPSNGPSYDAQHLILYPSYYYAQEPTLTKKGWNAHLLYSISEVPPQRKTPS
ncbi:hypothetical protein AB432_017215 [Brevibacillus brevis]|uniref:Uncharacterized protein n=1 Tax=Brevibacillus brevis TaxID=1393 RepID=A0A2Z4MJX7_BREBE|nr:hypothetical protein [Brevibacillus brevis]AWX56671.1 hypothetical protein AB432_017215 [Brevibacillus brevis]